MDYRDLPLQKSNGETLEVSGGIEVVEANVAVETPDGEADCYFVHPAKGRHAAVILWPDIFGMRPAFRQMGRRPGSVTRFWWPIPIIGP